LTEATENLKAKLHTDILYYIVNSKIPGHNTPKLTEATENLKAKLHTDILYYIRYACP
jgi:hypothetical protein